MIILRYRSDICLFKRRSSEPVQTFGIDGFENKNDVGHQICSLIVPVRVLD